MIKALLLDIEGTLGSLSFVRKVLFPHAVSHMDTFLSKRRADPEVAKYLDQVRVAVNQPSMAWQEISGVLKGWIAEDQKHTALKAIQGLIWEEGYHSGDYKAHVYPEVAEVLGRIKESGKDLYVYSSGSVFAQSLYFSYTESGNMSGLFNGFFDTTSGPKKEKLSYENITKNINLQPEEVLFVTDLEAELKAAQAAGLKVCQVIREGVNPAEGFTQFQDFEGVENHIPTL